MATLYEQDLVLWSEQQAEALREAAGSGIDLPIDWENVAEEIASLGRAEKRELVNRLTVLLTHLLKWQAQPGRRSTSWRLTIIEQRRKLERHLEDNPSLKTRLEPAIADAYGDALLRVQRQTGLPQNAFPPACLYEPSELLDPGYFPPDL